MNFVNFRRSGSDADETWAMDSAEDAPEWLRYLRGGGIRAFAASAAAARRNRRQTRFLWLALALALAWGAALAF